MKKLGARGIRWVKIVHISLGGMWLGGALALVVLGWAGLPHDGDELLGYCSAMKLVDDLVIIPGAVGSILTGLVFGLWTRWGFFKHRWVAVKWIVTVGQALFGTFFLGPWLNDAAAIASAERAAALENTRFVHDMTLNAALGTVQVALVLATIGISVLRPWGRRGTDPTST